jgi:hypothetical protein
MAKIRMCLYFFLVGSVSILGSLGSSGKQNQGIDETTALQTALQHEAEGVRVSVFTFPRPSFKISDVELAIAASEQWRIRKRSTGIQDGCEIRFLQEPFRKEQVERPVFIIKSMVWLDVRKDWTCPSQNVLSK